METRKIINEWFENKIMLSGNRKYISFPSLIIDNLEELKLSRNLVSYLLLIISNKRNYYMKREEVAKKLLTTEKTVSKWNKKLQELGYLELEEVIIRDKETGKFSTVKVKYDLSGLEQKLFSIMNEEKQEPVKTKAIEEKQNVSSFDNKKMFPFEFEETPENDNKTIIPEEIQKYINEYILSLERNNLEIPEINKKDINILLANKEYFELIQFTGEYINNEINNNTWKTSFTNSISLLLSQTRKKSFFEYTKDLLEEKKAEMIMNEANKKTDLIIDEINKTLLNNETNLEDFLKVLFEMLYIEKIPTLKNLADELYKIKNFLKIGRITDFITYQYIYNSMKYDNLMVEYKHYKNHKTNFIQNTNIIPFQKEMKPEKSFTDNDIIEDFLKVNIL